MENNTNTITIMSIDLDILMAPYCGIYNSYVHPGMDRKYNWETTMPQTFETCAFDINMDILDKINYLLTQYITAGKTIYTGYDHSSILTAINENKALCKDKFFDLYNIDYHHDIAYNGDQMNEFQEQGFANCGSWVGFLQHKHLLNSYTWFGGVGSSKPDSKLIGEVIPKLIIYKHIETNFDELKDINPDLVYVTTSPPWMPPHTDGFVSQLLHKIPTNQRVYYPYSFSPNSDAVPFLE